MDCPILPYIFLTQMQRLYRLVVIRQHSNKDSNELTHWSELGSKIKVLSLKSVGMESKEQRWCSMQSFCLEGNRFVNMLCYHME